MGRCHDAWLLERLRRQVPHGWLDDDGRVPMVDSSGIVPTAASGLRDGRENMGTKWIFFFIHVKPASAYRVFQRKGFVDSFVPNTKFVSIPAESSFLYFSFYFSVLQTGP